MKKYSSTTTRIITIFATIGLLTACGRGAKTGTANTSDYDTNTAVNTEVEYLGTEEYELKGSRPALTDEEKQEKYQRYLKEVLSNR